MGLEPSQDSLLPSRFDPSASLDFLWACIHIPRIWQGRDQRTPQAGVGAPRLQGGDTVTRVGPSHPGADWRAWLQKRREELVLRVRAPERIGLVELILAEAEARSQDGDTAGCSLLQARLPLLLSCCHGDNESVGEVTAHLTGCIQQWGNRYGCCVLAREPAPRPSLLAPPRQPWPRPPAPAAPAPTPVSSSVLGQRCRDLLVQLYLQRPELRGPAPEVLLHGEGATTSSICKVRPGQVLLRAASDLCF